MTRITSILLSMLIMFSLLKPSALVCHAADETVYSVTSADDLLQLAQQCNIDSFSEGIIVELKNDIDLKGSSFTSVPYFGGKFEGGGHTIKNFSITSDGSHQGFFRYVSDKAIVRNLHIEGTVAPSGSGCISGGIVGDNSGIISDCSFKGKVSGIESIGGIAGKNSGTITGCSFDGSVTGEHKIAGIAGENTGIITSCQNSGKINTIPISSSSSVSASLNSLNFDISEISEEDFLDITDIGGITGYSEGMIEKCENNGNVGYEHIGYNVGGIIGRQSGYVSTCSNSGNISGKKDVGGIVGQLEPYTAWDFSSSKLTKLKDKLDELYKKIDQIKAANDADLENLKDSIDTMQKYIKIASDDTRTMIDRTSDNINKVKTAYEQSIELLRNSINNRDYKKVKELLVKIREMINDGSSDVNISDLLDILSQIKKEETEHYENEHSSSDNNLSEELKSLISQAAFSEIDLSKLSSIWKNIMNNMKNINRELKDESDSVKNDIRDISEQFSALSEIIFSHNGNTEITISYETLLLLVFSDINDSSYEIDTEIDFYNSKLSQLADELDAVSQKITDTGNKNHIKSDNLKKSLDDMQKNIKAASDDIHQIISQISENINASKTSAVNITEKIKASIENHDHAKTKELLDELNTIVSDYRFNVNIDELLNLLNQLANEEKGYAEYDYDLISQLNGIISELSFPESAEDNLASDLRNIINSVENVKKELSKESGNIKNNINELSNQCSEIWDTFFDTAEKISEIKINSETDISLEYSEKYTNSLINSCDNHADINADTNAGGIVGSISYEIAFDAEDQLNISDYILSDAKYLIFAAVKNSESYGDVTVKKNGAGGIVGNMDFGAVKNSVGAGTIKVTNGDYCGGIAGLSKGNISKCYSRSLLSGEKYVGGIVGNGKNVVDCMSYSYINSGNEYIGSIAGNISGTVENCLFVQNDVGAVDNISYKGTAEPVTYQEMLKIDRIPDIFKKIVVTFVYNDDIIEETEVSFGGNIEKLPEVSMDGTRYWKWDDFDQEHIYYSITVNGKYYNPRTTIATDEEMPLFLAEGNFYEDQKLTAEQFFPDISDSDFNKNDIISAYTLKVNDYTGNLKVRMSAESGNILYVKDNSGKYKQTEYNTDGSYIVFDIKNGNSIVLVQKHSSNVLLLLICIFGCPAAIILSVILISKKLTDRKKIIKQTL